MDTSDNSRKRLFITTGGRLDRGEDMIKKEMIAMLLAGGQGSRLGVLTSKVAKPAVAFGGKYRIIDFPLSNCINSGVDTVGVLTQYQPLRLNTISESVFPGIWIVISEELLYFLHMRRVPTANGIPVLRMQSIRIWSIWRATIRNMC